MLKVSRLCSAYGAAHPWIPLDPVHLVEVVVIRGGERCYGGGHAYGERTQAISPCQTRRDVIVDAGEPVGTQVRHPAHDAAFRADVGDLVGAEPGSLQPGFHQGQCVLGNWNPVQHDVRPGQGELQPRFRLHHGRWQLAHQPD